MTPFIFPYCMVAAHTLCFCTTMTRLIYQLRDIPLPVIFTQHTYNVILGKVPVQFMCTCNHTTLSETSLQIIDVCTRKPVWVMHWSILWAIPWLLTLHFCPLLLEIETHPPSPHPTGPTYMYPLDLHCVDTGT